MTFYQAANVFDWYKKVAWRRRKHYFPEQYVAVWDDNHICNESGHPIACPSNLMAHCIEGIYVPIFPSVIPHEGINSNSTKNDECDCSKVHIINFPPTLVIVFFLLSSRLLLQRHCSTIQSLCQECQLEGPSNMLDLNIGPETVPLLYYPKAPFCM